MKSSALTLLLILLGTTGTQGSLISGSINKWSGFDYGWMREDVTGIVQTPHRMGSIQSQVDSIEHRVHYSFTPGVDGDYAQPMTYGKFCIY